MSPRILHTVGVLLAVAATPAIVTGHPLGLAAAFGSGLAFVMVAAYALPKPSDHRTEGVPQ